MLHTIGLVVVESHHLAPIHPIVGGVVVGRVDPGGCWVDPAEMACVEAVRTVG